MSKAGRNDLCHCGSGKKFKKCCAAKAAAPSISSRLILIAIVGAMLGAVIVGITQLTDDSAPPGPGRVWSPEHGHYH